MYWDRLMYCIYIRARDLHWLATQVINILLESFRDGFILHAYSYTYMQLYTWSSREPQVRYDFCGRNMMEWGLSSQHRVARPFMGLHKPLSTRSMELFPQPTQYSDGRMGVCCGTCTCFVLPSTQPARPSWQAQWYTWWIPIPPECS